MQSQPPHDRTFTITVEDGRREGEAGRLRDAMRGLLGQGCECILVNLAQATYVDSVLLGAIVQGYISAMRVGTTVKLLHASRKVKELLTVTRLDRVLESVDDDDG